MICKPQVKLLIKAENKPKFVNNDEKITFNKAYKSNNVKVRLVPNAGVKKRTDDGQNDAKIENELGKERGAVIDGACVKVMKTNKDRAVKHQELVMKVSQLITLFKAQP